MEQASNPFPLPGQIVEQSYGFRGFFRMIRNASLAQHCFGLSRNLQSAKLTTPKHNYLQIMSQNFLNIGKLDARFMMRTCFSSTPLTCAARPDLAIFETMNFPHNLYFHPSP
jgi:hypothetical protein